MKNLVSITLSTLVFLMISVIKLDAQTTEKTATVNIKTSAVCGECRDRIEHDLSAAKGVKKVSLDLKTKVATVAYNSDKTNPTEIKKAIAAIGYDADEVQASKAAFDKLPSCCKKGCSKQ